MNWLVYLLSAWAPCVPFGADFKIAKLAVGCVSPIDGILMTVERYQTFVRAEKTAALFDQCLTDLRTCESTRIQIVNDCRRDIAVLDCPEVEPCSNTAAWSVAACAVCAGAATAVVIGLDNE